jgi:flagellar assembly protein FliH
MTTSSLPSRGAERADLRVVSRAGVVAAGDGVVVRPLSLDGCELRSGGWTRLGASSVLGDTVTEHTLTALAAQTQEAARSQGYATGWAEGRRAADERSREQEQQAADRRRAEEERREAEHRSALAALARAAQDLQEAQAAVCARVESYAAEVAVALAEELVGHHLAAARTPGLDTVRRALALVPGEPVVRIRVSPSEAADPALAEVAGSAVVVADSSLQRGDALIETADAVLDARISGARDRVREVLLP